MVVWSCVAANVKDVGHTGLDVKCSRTACLQWHLVGCLTSLSHNAVTMSMICGVLNEILNERDINAWHVAIVYLFCCHSIKILVLIFNRPLEDFLFQSVNLPEVQVFVTAELF
jgi:hypothetical protein